MSKYAYLLGCRAAFTKLGMPYQGMGEEEEDPAAPPAGAPPSMEDEEEVPPEILAALMAQAQGQGQGEEAGPPSMEEEGEIPEELLTELAAQGQGQGQEEEGEIPEELLTELAAQGQGQEAGPPSMEEEEEVPEELLAELMAAQEQGQMPGQGSEGHMGGEPQAPTSDMFVDFANQNGIEGEADPNMEIPEAPGDEDNKPAWGGNSSLEGGDAGTRNSNMGLPQFSGA